MIHLEIWSSGNKNVSYTQSQCLGKSVYMDSILQDFLALNIFTKDFILSVLAIMAPKLWKKDHCMPSMQ